IYDKLKVSPEPKQVDKRTGKMPGAQNRSRALLASVLAQKPLIKGARFAETARKLERPIDLRPEHGVGRPGRHSVLLGPDNRNQRVLQRIRIDFEMCDGEACLPQAVLCRHRRKVAQMLFPNGAVIMPL